MTDASAYNVQFIGPDPVFIDHLSFRKYVDGEFWAGHRQFCEQFINPLLLQSVLGVPHNAWYRGALEGVPRVIGLAPAVVTASIEPRRGTFRIQLPPSPSLWTRLSRRVGKRDAWLVARARRV